MDDPGASGQLISRDTPLWRYLDLARYVSLLDSRSLYFPRSDLLGDSFEGSVSAPTSEGIRQAMSSKLAELGVLHDDAGRVLEATVPVLIEAVRTMTYICCWCMSERESAALWRVFAPSGVAVRSTVGRLIDALADSGREIYLGVVRYIDFRRDRMELPTAFHRFLYKRTSFDYERELRAVTWTTTSERTGKEPADREAGLYIPADLDRLVEAVHVSPEAPAWIEGIVRSMTARFGLDRDVIRSDLDSDPIF